jgi:predicted ferric reductase
MPTPAKKYKQILIYLILATTLPFLILLKDLDFSLLGSDSVSFWSSFQLYFGNILGFIGASLLIWEFLLGIRFLAALVTPDLMWINKLHGWLGKYGLLLIFVHPILEMLSYMESWSWIFLPDFSDRISTRITYGKFAFILLLIIYFTSAIARGKIKYRPWKYIHYLAYPLMFLVFVHALQLGTFLNKYVALRALWFTMLAMYLILIFVRVIWFSGIFNPTYKLIKKFKQSESLLILVFRPLGRKLVPSPGQYFYIQLRNFGESHPFSLMEYDPQTGDLVFGIKVQGKFTHEIDDLQILTEVKIDGPYGVFTQEAQNDKPKVIIAGGIGVTPFVELVKYYDSPTTIFMHSNRYAKEIIARPGLQSRLGNRYIDFISQDISLKDTNVVNSRLQPEHFASILGQEQIQYYNYFICGSPGFIQGVKKVLKGLNIPKNQIFAEEFGM